MYYLSTFTAEFSAACSAVFSALFPAGEISSSAVGDFFANILGELSAVVFAVFHADFFRKGNTLKPRGSLRVHGTPPGACITWYYLR